MIKKDPEGYKKLLVYKKSEELHAEVLKLSEEIKKSRSKIIWELADQLGRAARSPKSNIVEGWKRNSTKEYYEYLGFSIGSAEEIKEDCKDIISGKYKELMGVRGVMGERGIMGERGLSMTEVEKLPFYPLNPFLPLVVQVYLRSKELNMLLYKLQRSLEEKMIKDGTLSVKDKFKNREQALNQADEWLKQEMEKYKREKGE